MHIFLTESIYFFYINEVYIEKVYDKYLLV